MLELNRFYFKNLKKVLKRINWIVMKGQVMCQCLLIIKDNICKNVSQYKMLISLLHNGRKDRENTSEQIYEWTKSCASTDWPENWIKYV